MLREPLVSRSKFPGNTFVPFAYIISQVRPVEPEAFAVYRAQAPDIITAYGGEYLVRGGNPAGLEGTDPLDQLVVIRFPDREKALAWYHSSEYSSIRPMRFASAETVMWVVDGVASQ
jgi:uncharacterized protein (DUF1330 family)